MASAIVVGLSFEVLQLSGDIKHQIIEIPVEGDTPWYDADVGTIKVSQITDTIDKLLNKEMSQAPLRLPEKGMMPSMEIRALKSEHAIGLVGYLSQGVVWAEYMPRHAPQGRVYPTKDTIANTTKVSKFLRYLLLAQCHYEFGITMCHLSVIMAMFLELGQICALFSDPISEYRWDLDNLLMDGVGGKKLFVAKHLLRCLISGGRPIIDDILKRYNDTITYDFDEAINFLWYKRRMIIYEMQCKGFIGCEDPNVLHSRNSLYFAGEVVESTLMIRIMRLLFLRCHIPSLIWIHDGKYVHQNAPHVEVVAAFRESCVSSGMPPLLAKIGNLDEL